MPKKGASAGVQFAIAIRPPGPTDAEQLTRDAVLVGREHRSEHRQHGVEGRIGEGQVLGVAFDELGVESLGGRPGPGSLELRWREVDPDGVAPAPRRRERGIARSRCDVQDAQAGANPAASQSNSAAGSIFAPSGR